MLESANPLVAGKGIRKLTQANIETKIGLLEDQAKALHSGFNGKNAKKKLPFVWLKAASSLMLSYRNGWMARVSGLPAKRLVLKFTNACRFSGALVTGLVLLLADDP